MVKRKTGGLIQDSARINNPRAIRLGELYLRLMEARGNQSPQLPSLLKRYAYQCFSNGMEVRLREQGMVFYDLSNEGKERLKRELRFIEKGGHSNPRIKGTPPSKREIKGVYPAPVSSGRWKRRLPPRG